MYPCPLAGTRGCMPEFLAQWPDRGPPSHSPQLDQEPLWRRANGSPHPAWKLRSVGHRLPFRGGFACLQERGALRGSSLPRSSGIFSKFFLDFPLPGLFHSSALRRVVLVCRVGPSPQIASLSHSHRPSYVIYRQRALPSLLPPPPPALHLHYRQSDLTPPPFPRLHSPAEILSNPLLSV
jgi:hypothetical protein